MIIFKRSIPNKSHFSKKCAIKNWAFQLKHEYICQSNKLTKKKVTEEIKNTFIGIIMNAFKRS